MLNLNVLPDLPQSTFLREILPRIWADQSVQALWLGGSLANGRGDRYSDIDLRLAVAPEHLAQWRKPDLAALFQQPIMAQFLLPFGEAIFLHHLILESGEIYDLYVQSTEQPLTPEKRLVFGSRDPALLATLGESEEAPEISYDPANPGEILGLLQQYWVILHKGQKVNYRGLRILTWEGINLMRFLLLRLYYIQITGQDCGDLRRMSIHTWTPIAETIQTAVGDEVHTLLGQPTVSNADIINTVEHLNEAFTAVSRNLANQYGFPYPEQLASTVQQHWAEFVRKEMQG